MSETGGNDTFRKVALPLGIVGAIVTFSIGYGELRYSVSSHDRRIELLETTLQHNLSEAAVQREQLARQLSRIETILERKLP